MMKNNDLTAHERTRLLLDATPLACRLMKRVCNEKYELFECNEESVKLFKFKDKREFIERYFEIFPEYQPDGKKSIPEGRKIFEKAFIEGKCVSEFVFQTSDGELIPAEVTLVRLEYEDDYIVAGYTRDMREHKRMMAAIETRNRLLNTGSLAVQALLSTEDDTDIEKALLESLEVVGRAVSADRVQIWRNEMIDEALHFVHTYVWMSEIGKQNPSVSIGLKLPYTAVPKWEKLFSGGGYINGQFTEMSEEEQQLLKPYDVKTIVIIPLFIKYVFWGFFCVIDCVNERIFTDDEINVLKAVSRMVVSAINRNMQAAQIREAHNRTRLLLDTTPLAIHLWDKNINLFECNEESLRLFKAKDKQEYSNRFRDLSPKYQPDGSLSSEIAPLNIKKAFEDGKHVFEWMHQATDGTPIPSEITLVRVAYENDFAVAGYVRDLREQKAMMNEIEQKSNLLDSVNQAANILLQSEIDEFENNLQLCMGMIGKAVNADRICIWKNSIKEGKLHCTLVDEWIADELLRTSSEISTDVPYEGNIPTFEHILTKGECINSLVRDLSPIEQSRMTMHGIKSIFVAPVFVHDEFWGFVGCDNCFAETIFSEEVVTTLRSGSLLIANALLRNEMTSNLQKAADELKTALMDTQKANDAKSDFLANMSHEMRTPLNAVIGLSELALEDSGINKDVETNLEKIYSAGETLLSLVNDILDISKIEAGKLELIESAYDTPSLINDTVTNNILRLGEKPIEFILNIHDDLPAKLYGDELRVKQVLSNLLSNAFKYTKQGTVELGVDCVRENDVVWLIAWAKDSGIGIKAEDIGNLFSNYTQMDTKSNRKIEGTGLGLPIAKRLIEQMGGTITVDSEYGKGSTFTVKIKQKYVAAATIGLEVAKSLKSFRYSDHRRNKNAKFARIKLPYARVLVVDDNATNLDVVKGLMKPYGMQIDTVMSGQQAIDAMRMENVKYNAIFMDHMMPGMDGIEATEKIREIGTDYAKNIPVIALTANVIAGNDKMFLSKGFQDFLSKPIDISRLDAVIHYWVQDKKMKNEKWKIEKEDTSESVSDSQSLILNFQFDGIDLKAGLERFGWDSGAYLQVLRSYTTNTRNLLGSIKEVSRENLKDYAITVHGIKGSSRSICANLVGDIAEALEKAAKEGDFEYVCEKAPDLVQAIAKLLENLDEMLVKISAEAHKPIKSKPDKDVLVKILEACYTFDMETIEAAVKELESYEYETNGELVYWLWENVQQFNVDEIIGKLSEMNLGKDYS
ncbi:MAG: ATP-binding protein [Spirochaetaceae bacterium]|nr:ATP-binding protein [Spirochaetaceae bacterium]